MKKILLAGAALSFLAAPAMAADLPVKAPPLAPPPVFSWTGFYIGANVGGTWMDNDAIYTQTGVVSAATHLQSSSVIGGGQVGFNWQTGMFVLGAEGDIAARHLRDTRTVLPFAPANVIDQVVLSQTENWVGTVRGRFGVTFDRVLFYGTGGVAFGDVSHSYNQVRTTTGQAVGVTNSETKTGWAAGVGIEYAVWNNISVGVEYLHVDLGNTTLVQPVAVTVAGLTFPPSSARFEDVSDMVRLKVNWRFGSGF